MAGNPTWGIVSTVRGPTPDILRFVAYHLDLGVDRMYIFLDEPNPAAFGALDEHTKIDVHTCDHRFWASRKRDRPEAHQTRQTANASFTYRNTDVDWLTHIDMDEFLWPDRPISQCLARVPDDLPGVRVRPIEALASGEDLYKTFIPKGPDREKLVQTIYPSFGTFVRSGFFSHLQGKVFARTGLPKISFRIHNLLQNGDPLPCKTELSGVDVCHRHAPDWDSWLAHLPFRLKLGSYRAEMSPNVPRTEGGMNMYELLTRIEAENGIDGLRSFFDEISGADPEVRARLEKFGMLRHRPLNLNAKLAKHFPGSA